MSNFMQVCNEQGQCFWKHVKKHPKKYFFVFGTAFGIVAFKVITLFMLGGASLLGTGTQPIEEKALAVFEQIDAIAHTRDDMLHGLGKEHFLIWEMSFHAIDDTYHASTDLVEKFHLAQRLDSLIHRQDEFIAGKGYVSPADESAFQDIEYTFDTLYNRPQTLDTSSLSDQDQVTLSTILAQLFSVATQRNLIIQKLGEDSFLIRKDSYTPLMLKFYSASTLQEQFEIARKMSNLLYRQNEFFVAKGYVNPVSAEGKAYQEAQDALLKLTGFSPL